MSYLQPTAQERQRGILIVSRMSALLAVLQLILLVVAIFRNRDFVDVIVLSATVGLWSAVSVSFRYFLYPRWVHVSRAGGHKKSTAVILTVLMIAIIGTVVALLLIWIASAL